MDPLLNEIAQKHNRSPGQICLRWNVQHGNIILPKSVTTKRIEENKNVFDFELTQEEMKQLDALHKLEKVKPYEKMLCE